MNILTLQAGQSICCFQFSKAALFDSSISQSRSKWTPSLITWSFLTAVTHPSPRTLPTASSQARSAAHFQHRCKSVWKLHLFLYEVIEADSKPVKVRLDFDEEDLPFYCNLLTWPESLPKTWPGTGPEKPSKKLKQKNVEKKKNKQLYLSSPIPRLFILRI